MRNTLAIITLTAFLALGGAASSAASPPGPTGPVYPPPGGVTFGSSGDIGRTGGLTWSYSGFTQSGWTHMIYGSAASPDLAFDAPNGTGPCASCDTGVDEPGETLSFSAGDSNLAGGVLVWTGSAKINVLGSNTTLPTRLTMTVTDGNGAVSLMDPSSVGLDPEIGGLVLVDTHPSYSVNLVFEAQYAATWTPVKDLFDSLSTDPGAMVQDDFQAGFWYVNPAVQLSTPSLSFGSQPVGSPTSDQQVTITNSGNDDLKNIVLSLSGANAGDFAIDSTTCSSTLSPGSNCTVDVSFDPQAAGPRSASLDVASNADSSPDQVSLSGTGTAAASTVSIAPGSLSFGSQPIKTSSPYQSVVLTNTGGVPVHVSGLSVTGSGASSFKLASQTCTAAPVAPGDTCSVLVRFAPGTLGPKIATLAIADDAAGGPHTVPLSGSGVESADLWADIGDLPSPVVSNGSLTWSITIANNGPSVARNVVLTDVLPSDVRMVSITPGTGIKCTAPHAGSTGTVTCTVKSIKKHASRQVDVTVTVLTPSGGHISDTAAVSSSTFDPVAGNDRRRRPQPSPESKGGHRTSYCPAPATHGRAPTRFYRAVTESLPLTGRLRTADSQSRPRRGR